LVGSGFSFCTLGLQLSVFDPDCGEPPYPFFEWVALRVVIQLVQVYLFAPSASVGLVDCAANGIVKQAQPRAERVAVEYSTADIVDFTFRDKARAADDFTVLTSAMPWALTPMVLARGD